MRDGKDPESNDVVCSIPRPSALTLHRGWEQAISDDANFTRSADPPLPAQVGAYRIEGRLGAGGMGEVYRGWDDKLDRPVALKRVAPDAAEAEGAREMFRREARAVARLHHGSIVQVFELIENEDGDWLVMELVEGRSLRELCGGKRMKPARVIEISRGICTGLTAAHDAGIVHRDLKLDNVMLTATGEVKILDFGIYKRLGADDASSMTQTLSVEGRLVGTVTAMSPEQAAGGEIDHRSDLFSLGSLLYELLTGQPPFVGRNSHETLSRICLHKETPASEVSPEVPESLSRLVSLLLEKEPANRPQSAEQVQKALSQVTAEMSGVIEKIDPSTWTGFIEAPAREIAPVATEALTTPSGPAVRTLLLNDLVDSTKMVDALGDERAAQIFEQHDRLAREILKRNNGREIDKSDGFLMLFERPMDAVRFALGYHAALEEISEREGVSVTSRVGIHVGEVVLRVNSAEDVARGAKPLEVEGLAKAMAARFMGLAGSGQTLISRGVFDLGKRAAVGATDLPDGLRWVEHGRYTMKGVEEPVGVFEVGVVGRSPLSAPADTKKVKRVKEVSGRLAGWSLRMALATAAILAILAGFGARQLWQMRGKSPPLYVVVPETTLEPIGERTEMGLEARAVHDGVLRGVYGYHQVAAIEPDPGASRIEDPQELAYAMAADEVLLSRLDCVQLPCQVVLKRIAGSDGRLLWSHRFTMPNEELLTLTVSTAEQLRSGYPEVPLREGVPELEVLPKDYEDYLRLRESYRGRREGSSTETILAELERLKSSSPRFVDIYLLDTHISRKYFFESRQASFLERALKNVAGVRALSDRDPRLLREEFLLFLESGKVEEANGVLDRLSDLEPGNALVLQFRARILERQGHGKRALALMHQAAERRPSLDFFQALADMSFRLGDHQSARKALEDQLARSPEYYDTRSRLAATELVYGDLGRASELYEELVQRQPEEAELTNLGIVYLLQEQFADAAASFRRALELAPDSPYALLNLADAELLRGEKEISTALYQQVVEKVAQDPDPDALLTVGAQAAAHLGRNEEAVAAVRRALRLAPENAQVAYEASIVFVIVGEHASALFEAQRALEAGVEMRWFDFQWFGPIRDRLAAPSVS